MQVKTFLKQVFLYSVPYSLVCFHFTWFCELKWTMTSILHSKWPKPSESDQQPVGQPTLDTPVPTTCLGEAALSFHSSASARYWDTAAGRHRVSSNCRGTGTPAETLLWWAQEPEGTPGWGPILQSDGGSLRKNTKRRAQVNARIKRWGFSS